MPIIFQIIRQSNCNLVKHEPVNTRFWLCRLATTSPTGKSKWEGKQESTVFTIILRPLHRMPDREAWVVCQSQFQQGDWTSRRRVCLCIKWYLLQGIGLRDCGDWLGKSKIHSVSHQEEHAGNSGAQADAAVHRGIFFLLRKISVLLLRPSKCLDQVHPGYPG